jgi:hypothetical protein
MKKLFVVVTIACLGTILLTISAQTPSPSPDASADEQGTADENTDRTERCDCPSSPDGKFAFLVSDTEEKLSSERLQILDLIEKKSGKKLQRIDDAAMPVLWSVLWAPDSNGFALRTKVVGHPRLQGVDVYFQSGVTFQKVELPDLPDTDVEKEVVWSPDSKHFVLNYTTPNLRTDYQTVAFYQLRGDKLVTLHSPVSDRSGHSQLTQLARKYSPRNAHQKGDSSPVLDRLEARSWTDANTVILYAYSEREGGEAAAALFTLKFDKEGNSKVVKMHRLSKKELEEKR